jgi:CRISPR-associated protein Cas1
MQSLYISRQGCYLGLEQETIVVKQKQQIIQKVQLPLTEQILIFGQSQITTPLIHTCLKRNIIIGYLSRMGYCYGRLLPIERGYRQLSRYQQEISQIDRLLTARNIVKAKLKNSRTFLLRQQRRHPQDNIKLTIDSLQYLIEKTDKVETIEQLMGLEGAGAAYYFPALGECLQTPEFIFLKRSRRPPTNPVNSLLSFGYQVLWNHLLSLIELQGLDPYISCLHQGSERHAALASDLIEEFRTPLIDSLVLWLINSKIMKINDDFEYRNSGCFLNNSGRSKYLHHWLKRMEENIQTNQGKFPRWDLLNQQVKLFKQFIYQPTLGYQPYTIT